MRTGLLGLTGLPGLHDLDRADMTVWSALDLNWNTEATRLLRSLAAPAFVSANGLAEPRLLDIGDPGQVLYSVTLLERIPSGNALRLQTDNFEGPLNLATSSRLELGSAAKLRALVTYLEVVEEAHARLLDLPTDSLRRMVVRPEDRIPRCVVEHLLAEPGSSRSRALSAALDRTYSANPAERFFTGAAYRPSRISTASSITGYSRLEAFRHSVNLPFVRLMRDVVAYEMSQGGSARVLSDPAHSLRQDYLTRFGEAEGVSFVRQFYRK